MSEIEIVVSWGNRLIEVLVVYTIQLPASLPPAHRGRAFRFSYDLVVSLTVALPGPGKRQKSKEIEVPIRVWANVSRESSHESHLCSDLDIRVVADATTQSDTPFGRTIFSSRSSRSRTRERLTSNCVTRRAMEDRAGDPVSTPG